MKIISAIFRDAVKTALCYLGYKHRESIIEEVKNVGSEIYHSPKTQAMSASLCRHWEKSLKALKRAKLALYLCIVGIVAFGVSGYLPFDPKQIESIRVVGGAFFVGIMTLAFASAFIQLIKFQVVDELLVYGLITLRNGYEGALRLLPDFVGKNLSEITDPAIKPFVEAAKKLSNIIWTVFIGIMCFALYVVFLRIYLKPTHFAMLVLAGFIIIAYVIRWRPKTEYLRNIAIAQATLTFVIIGISAIYPSLITVSGVRKDCIEQYYKYGVPKDKVFVSKCEQMVEANMMEVLNGFSELNFKPKGLNENEQRTFAVYKSVIQSALAGEVKEVIFPAPTPVAPVAVMPMVKPETKKATTKPPSTSGLNNTPKPETSEALERIRARHKKVAELLN